MKHRIQYAISTALLALASHCFAVDAIDGDAANLLASYSASPGAGGPVGYHDLIMGNNYHMYFTFRSDVPSASYRRWTDDKLRREFLPKLDRYACSDTLTAAPGDDLAWPEYRRKGGNVVVHIRSLADLDYSMDVSFPGHQDLCQ
ncbi:hypothetical protein KDW69_15665 [Burkholderia ambifaria]|uniref:hypothetical protein n=1 Tax=Burkholderia ambifaria TaxID=152480 RepID=UPI001BA2EBF4|nr:hypothetical protein [Burkholderia ambifaria]MBR8333082.1 hypothetical protein [Burkholderia ambifaria]